jgi:hypothetical protein
MLGRFRPPNARERGLSRGEIYKKEERKRKKKSKKKKQKSKNKAQTAQTCFFILGVYLSIKPRPPPDSIANNGKTFDKIEGGLSE